MKYCKIVFPSPFGELGLKGLPKIQVNLTNDNVSVPFRGIGFERTIAPSLEEALIM